MELALVFSVVLNVVVAFAYYHVTRINNKLLRANVEYLKESSDPEIRHLAELMERKIGRLL